MSSRRILRKNAEILKQRITNKQLQNMKIRGFQSPGQYIQLCKPSSFLHIVQHKKSVKSQLQKMMKFVAYRKLVYMTDIQISNFYTYFTIHKNPIQGRWVGDPYNKAQDFQVYANPVIQQKIGQQKNVNESCFSLPFIMASAKRNTQIKVRYTKVHNLLQPKEIEIEEVTQRLKGFKATLFQHCMDHLEGKTIMNPNISEGKIAVEQTVAEYLKKTQFLLNQYGVRIKKIKGEKVQDTEQLKKIQKQYEQRIRKQYLIELVETKSQIQKHKMMKF